VIDTRFPLGEPNHLDTSVLNVFEYFSTKDLTLFEMTHLELASSYEVLGLKMRIFDCISKAEDESNTL
jgi:hypothetical protein